jgi:beta-mannosidase
VSAGEVVGWHHFAEDVDTALPTADLTVDVRPEPGGHRVEVTANCYVRDLALLVDRVDPDAVVDQMLVTLLPGERTVFWVTGAPGASVEQLTDPLVLRCSNQLARRDVAAAAV